MAWIFVSPANRGIGYALTRHLLQTTKAPIIATSRTNAPEAKRSLLADLPDVDANRLTVLDLDVTDEASVESASSQARAIFPPPTHHLRLAFVVPGILRPEKSPAQVSAADALETFRVNTVGPLLVMKHFAAFLPKKKAVLEAGVDEEGLPGNAVWGTMSARVGSTSDNALGGWFSYRASKAGVNSLTKTFDLWLRNTSGEKAMAIALHPGTVKTGLSKEFWAGVPKEKLFSPEFAAERLVNVVRSLDVSDGRGKCWDWLGKEIKP